MAASATHEWGRIDDDGNVYVRVGGSERLIGQWLGGDPSEGLAMYERRFQGLATEVELLEERVRSGTLSPDNAAKAVDTIRGQINNAQALGDLDGLLRRLDAVGPVIEEQREARRAERAQRAAEAKEAKDRIVAEAEQVADSDDYKHGIDRMHALIEEWKATPRINRQTDDALWRRLSSARSSFNRKRKAHFAEQAARREEAAGIKEKIVREAESLASSTDWGATTGKYRDLMQRWKQAGPAPRGTENTLWKRFRAARDTFFAARDDANAELEAQYEANAAVKEQILAEAEGLLPVSDIDAARRQWHDIAQRWEQAGKVPRSRMKEMEGRLKAVEHAIRNAESSKWEHTDPEKTARADDMIAKLQSSIQQLERELQEARDNGNTSRIAKLESDLSSQKSFLETARQASDEFQ